MKSKLILFVKFIVAVLSCFVVASIAHSQFVLSELTAIGIDVSLSERLDMTLSDIAGLLVGYGSVILVALGLGFLIVNAISKWLIAMPAYRYPIAGFIAMGGALLAMYPLLNVTLIAGAREPLGFIFQCLAGLIGGSVFMLLTQSNHTKES